MPEDIAGITALVLAGQRPGTDPLAAAHGLERKALVPVAGEPMLVHVLRTLATHRSIDRILVAAQDSAIVERHPALAKFQHDERITFLEAGSSIAATLSELLKERRLSRALVTTADNVLLTHEMVDHVLGEAAGRDVAIAMVQRRVLMAAYPGSRRSWLKFRGGAWSGANLFWIGGPQVQPLVDIWRDVEQDRKKGWRVVSAFGPGLLIGAMLRLVTLERGIEIVGERYGIDAAMVPMPQADACIDVDKLEDLELAERILANRQAVESA